MNDSAILFFCYSFNWACSKMEILLQVKDLCCIPKLFLGPKSMQCILFCMNEVDVYSNSRESG